VPFGTRPNTRLAPEVPMTRMQKLAIRERILLDYERGRLTISQARQRLIDLERERPLDGRPSAAPARAA